MKMKNNRDEDEKIDVDQPYYGWSGWDRDAMQEEVKENFYIEPPKPVLTKPTKKKTKPKIKSKVRKSSLLNKTSPRTMASARRRLYRTLE